MGSLWISCLIAFFAGAVYEAACVGWVHYSERGRALVTALFSMLIGTAEVTGIVESVRQIEAAPFFVVGYGVGTYVAVTIKSRWRRK